MITQKNIKDQEHNTKPRRIGFSYAVCWSLAAGVGGIAFGALLINAHGPEMDGIAMLALGVGATIASILCARTEI